MLNKLLKRCMPWMDKGRWYKLVLKGTTNSFVIDHDKSDPVFAGASVVYDVGSKLIEIENPGIVFLDLKCVAEYSAGDSPIISGLTTEFFSYAQYARITGFSDAGLTPGEGVTIIFYIFGR